MFLEVERGHSKIARPRRVALSPGKKYGISVSGRVLYISLKNSEVGCIHSDTS